MGRGLSELQKHILATGHRNRITGQSKTVWYRKDPIDVSTRQILVARFGWGYSQTTMASGVFSPGFSPQAVGEKKYAALHASISRAMKRLQERGFVVRYHNEGCTLTPLGMQHAYRLNCPDVETI